MNLLLVLPLFSIAFAGRKQQADKSFSSSSDESSFLSSSFSGEKNFGGTKRGVTRIFSEKITPSLKNRKAQYEPAKDDHISPSEIAYWRLLLDKIPEDADLDRNMASHRTDIKAYMDEKEASFDLFEGHLRKGKRKEELKEWTTARKQINETDVDAYRQLMLDLLPDWSRKYHNIEQLNRAFFQ